MDRLRDSGSVTRRTLVRAAAGTTAAMLAAQRLGRDFVVAAQSTPTAGELPADAAPRERQILRTMGREGRYLDWSKSVQQRQFESALIPEPLVRRDAN